MRKFLLGVSVVAVAFLLALGAEVLIDKHFGRVLTPGQFLAMKLVPDGTYWYPGKVVLVGIGIDSALYFALVSGALLVTFRRGHR
jgi:hypothetical protein